MPWRDDTPLTTRTGCMGGIFYIVMSTIFLVFVVLDDGVDPNTRVFMILFTLFLLGGGIYCLVFSIRNLLNGK